MRNFMIQSQLLSVKNAALLTRRGERTIYNWIESEKIKTYVVNGVNYVDGVEVLKYESTTKRGRPRHAQSNS